MSKQDMIWHLVLHLGQDFIYARALLTRFNWNLEDAVGYIIDQDLVWKDGTEEEVNHG